METVQGLPEAIGALTALVEQSTYVKNPIIEHNKKHYWAENMKEVQPKQYRESIRTRTLQSIVDYVAFGLEDKGIKKEEIFIHVSSINEVNIYKIVDGEKKREHLLCAKIDQQLKTFEFDEFLYNEPFIIGLYSMFVDTEERAAAIEKASKLKLEVGVGSEDDGSSSIDTTKSEIIAGNKTAIFSLAPFRTFRELEQPSSSFVFRVNKQFKCGLFEADGGAWRITAIDLIKGWLKSKIEDVSIIA